MTGKSDWNLTSSISLSHLRLYLLHDISNPSKSRYWKRFVEICLIFYVLCFTAYYNFIYIIAAAEVDFAVQWIYREISVRTMLIMCGVVFPREHFTKWRSVNKNLLNNSCRHQLCTFLPFTWKVSNIWKVALLMSPCPLPLTQRFDRSKKGKKLVRITVKSCRLILFDRRCIPNLCV